MVKKDKYDITGQDFNDWSVLQEIDDPREGRYFECLCNLCGDIHAVHGVSIRLGRSKRCKACARRNQSIDMIGKKYGEWTVLQQKGKQHNSYAYLCRCSCGHEAILHGPSIRYGESTKCVTCSNKEKALNNTTHGMAREPLYKVWSAMKNRCQDKNNKAYHRYGGRGITVCDRWQKFENFLIDMAPRPSGMTLDRIDNDGPYSKENCRWVSHYENCQNRFYDKKKGD